MNIAIIRLLAWRYITGFDSTSRISTISKICFLSIMSGTWCLALQLFVARGFDQALEKKMQSIYPQLILKAPDGQSFDYVAIRTQLKQQYADKIDAIAPSHTKRVALRSVDSKTLSAVMIKAVDPELEPLVSTIDATLDTRQPLSKSLGDDSIIIGKQLAEFYDLRVGDSCVIVFTPEQELSTDNAEFDSVRVTVGAVMETGIVQYDKYTIICSLGTMNYLLKEQEITEIGIKLNRAADERHFVQSVEKTFGVEVDSWKTLYPALVSAAQLEKYVMSLLIALMTCIATANIIALIFMQITRKRADIALLKTLGMNQPEIVLLFTLMGAIIVTTAAFTGVLGAAFSGYLLDHYRLITLPDAYFCAHVPACIEFQTTLLVALMVSAIGIATAWFSAQSVRSLNITQILRFES